MRRPIVFAGVSVLVVLMVGGIGIGTFVMTRPVATPTFSNPIALTSPTTRQVLPAGLADPNTPAYQAGSGFTPDAVRVLTVTVLRASLARFYADTGHYPSSLDILFPRYAPPAPDGKPMTNPPSAADGFTYGTTGSSFTLSVVLASGDSYVITGP